MMKMMMMMMMMMMIMCAITIRRVGGIEDVKRQMLEMNLMLKEFYFTWGSKFARIE